MSANAQEVPARADAPQSASESAPSWTERARALRDVGEAEALAAELATRLELARAEPGFTDAWLGRTYGIVFASRAARADAPEFERCAAVARDAARALRSAEGALRAEVEVAWWNLEGGRAAAAEDVRVRAEGLRARAPRLAQELDLLHVVLARRSGDLDAVTRVCSEARAQLVRLLAEDEAAPESRVVWLPYHGELAAHLASELGRARLDAGLPELAATAFEDEGTFASAIPRDATAEPFRSAALARHAQDRLWLALGTERFELALECCETALDGSLALEPAERADFEIGRAVARSEQARGRAEALPACLSELERLARSARAGELAVDASQRAAVELALADVAVRASQWDTAREALASCDVGVTSAGGVEREPWLARSSASAAAFGVRLALETHAPRTELVRARDVLRARFELVLADWERRALRPGGVGFLYWGTQRLVVSELISAELALEPGAAGAEAALAHLVRAQRVGTLARSLLGDWAPDWNAVRDELAQSGGGWFVLFPAMDRTHLFLVDGTRVEHVELASRDRIARASLALRRTLQLPPGGAYADERRRELVANADALGELVLPGPARERLREWRRVRVAGAELCQGLPFECLRLDGEWLGCARAVSHVPSLPVAAGLARRARTRGVAPRAGLHDFVLFAEPELSPAARARWSEQVSITLADEDEAALTAPFGAGRALVLRGAAASTAALGSREVANCTVLGLLTHGVIAAEHERSARLLLAPGAADRGDLGGEDIDALSRTPPCVLLCSCGSAGGPQRLGDDTGAHLASAFLLRGTDVVLVSRGDVSYLATVALTARTLHELADGAAPDEALRAARAALAASDEFADPFYFGLVSLTGLADRRTFTLDAPPRSLGATARVGLVTAALLALASFVAWAVRARHVGRARNV